MKKIFAFVGSQRGNKSNTTYFTKRILDKVVEKSDGKVIYEIFTAKDVHIQRCKGCGSCFEMGICPLDENDDMLMLKNKMLESDFIILGSPVYGWNVTGDMKIFIDRIIYWWHLIRLAGKDGVAISTTSHSGDICVLNYLYQTMLYSGINVVGKFNASVDEPVELYNEQFENTYVEKYSDVILECIFKKNVIEIDRMLEYVFKISKHSIKLQESRLPHSAEYLYWHKNRYMNCESFVDLLKLKKYNNV